METEDKMEIEALRQNECVNEMQAEGKETGMMLQEKRVNAPFAPFLHSKDTTSSVMRDVTIALLPAAIFGVYRFGFRAFLILLLSVTSCVLTEHVCKRLHKGNHGGYECSAVVTGLLFGMMLPLNVPYWLPVAGGVFAIGVVKMLFGGLGRNRLNPAATAKCVFFVLAGPVLHISMSGYLYSWSEASIPDLFFGFSVGMVGEGSAFLLLLGGIYLVLCKVITLHTPVTYLAAFSAVLLLFGNHGPDAEWLAMHLCVGGVMLGAFFLATDYSTSPMTKTGKVMYGACLGALTGVLRIFGFTVEAVALAVVCGNLLVPLLDWLTLPRAPGKRKRTRR